MKSERRYSLQVGVAAGLLVPVGQPDELRESWQPETWGERVCGSWLLPCWQRQADRTLWRARPTARGLWYSHRSVWPVEAIECRGRCRCQGGQHSYHLGDADWHCAAVPLLPAAAAHRQPVCAAAPWGWVWWVCGQFPPILLLRWEVRQLYTFFESPRTREPSKSALMKNLCNVLFLFARISPPADASWKISLNRNQSL